MKIKKNSAKHDLHKQLVANLVDALVVESSEELVVQFDMQRVGIVVLLSVISMIFRSVILEKKIWRHSIK